MEAINLSGTGHEVIEPGIAVILVVGSVLGVLIMIWLVSKLNDFMDDT